MRRALALLLLAMLAAGCDPSVWDTSPFHECMRQWERNPRGVTFGEAVVECEVEARSRIEWGY